MAKMKAMAKKVERNLRKAIEYLEKERGIPVYWRLDAEGNIVTITTDPRVAKKEGCVRAHYS